MTLEEKRSVKKNNIRIQELKCKLSKDDYIDNKLTEALAIKEVTGDNTRLLEVYAQYKDLLAEREIMRKEINELEEELSSLSAE